MAVVLSVSALADTPNPGDPDHPGNPPPPPVVFDSRQEGMYAVTLTCDPRPEDCNPSIMQTLDRLSIVDSRSAFGVWVTLASTQVHDVYQSFYGSIVGPSATELNAQPRLGSKPGRFSQVHVVIDPATGSLTGEIFDVRTSGTLILHGQPLVRAADLISRGGVKLDSMLGAFRGSLVAGMPGQLMIRATPLGRIVGYFASDKIVMGAPEFSLDFSSGFFDSVTGLLHLVNDNPRFGNVGEVALVRDGNSIHGLYFNAFVSSSSEFAAH